MTPQERAKEKENLLNCVKASQLSTEMLELFEEVSKETGLSVLELKVILTKGDINFLSNAVNAMQMKLFFK